MNQSLISIEENKTIDQKIQAKTPYASIFREVVNKAVELRASDIHIEPYKNGVRILFRVDGERSLYKTLETLHRQSFINEAKHLAALSIARKGKIQDARASYPSLKLDVRANILPVIHDDNLVLRLLDTSRNIQIDKSGFDNETLEQLKELTKMKNGLVLISGPTGSGKTSTLYGLINEIDRIKKNVITIENPVEKEIDWASQVEIKDTKLTFADALKASMRQDPDIILVGEIRDRESAELALEAAGTGHLVFSTIHANNALDVISRLDDLKVSLPKIKSYLRFSAAQRLIKKLCPDCKLPISPENLYVFKKYLKENSLHLNDYSQVMQRNPNGCENCSKIGEKGVSGRLPILEYVNKSQITNFINGVASGHMEMKEAALNKAKEGLICFSQIKEIE